MGNETITESEIWADLDAAFILPPRLPGDIDCRQLMERYHLSENGARTRMAALERKGWKKLEVADDTSSNGKRKVVRKVE